MNSYQERKLAEEFGAKCFPDVARGTPWERYEIGEWKIWLCSQGWACAREQGNLYVDHIYYRTLREAFVICKDKKEQKIILSDRQKVIDVLKPLLGELKDPSTIQTIEDVCNKLS